MFGALIAAALLLAVTGVSWITWKWAAFDDPIPKLKPVSYAQQPPEGRLCILCDRQHELAQALTWGTRLWIASSILFGVAAWSILRNRPFWAKAFAGVAAAAACWLVLAVVAQLATQGYFNAADYFRDPI